MSSCTSVARWISSTIAATWGCSSVVLPVASPGEQHQRRAQLLAAEAARRGRSCRARPPSARRAAPRAARACARGRRPPGRAPARARPRGCSWALRSVARRLRSGPGRARAAGARALRPSSSGVFRLQASSSKRARPSDPHAQRAGRRSLRRGRRSGGARRARAPRARPGRSARGRRRRAAASRARSPTRHTSRSSRTACASRALEGLGAERAACRRPRPRPIHSARPRARPGARAAGPRRARRRARSASRAPCSAVARRRRAGVLPATAASAASGYSISAPLAELEPAPCRDPCAGSRRRTGTDP